MQRVYEENEWGKVSKRIITPLLSFPSSTSAPAPPTSTPSDNPLLLFIGASHAERNSNGLIQSSRNLTKLMDAQKATRKIQQETKQCAQDLLSKDLDQSLTKHCNELEDLAQQHGKKVEAIKKLVASGHYKHKRSVNIENAKIHMKSHEVNAGKSAPLLPISIPSFFINRSRHG